MRASFWGVRGGLPTARAAMLGVGGNTPCEAVALPDVHLVLDAGTGICARRCASASAAPARWLSGVELAKDANVLVHDAQFSDDRYRVTRGWGHSTVTHAVRFADVLGVEQLRLFHHDPSHDDAVLAGLERHARDADRRYGRYHRSMKAFSIVETASRSGIWAAIP